MTDKVQKIRKEIERRKSLIGNNSFLSDYEKGCNDGREDMCDELISIIDSMQEESVSGELEKASYYFACKCHPLKTEYSTSSPNPEVKEAFKAGAQWQLEQMKEILRTEYEKGRYDMREQMLSKAVECEVKIDTGGYPYIPAIELYDYDKDVPLAKEGDKYKVILIKEECS